MTKKQVIKLFEERKVRTVWDDQKEKWYFCVVDVVETLTDSVNPTDYIKKMKKRDPELAKGWGQIVTPPFVANSWWETKSISAISSTVIHTSLSGMVIIPPSVILMIPRSKTSLGIIEKRICSAMGCNGTKVSTSVFWTGAYSLLSIFMVKARQMLWQATLSITEDS